MKLILITQDAKENAEKIIDLIPWISGIGYTQLIIPLETRDINLVKRFMEARGEIWVVTKEVEDTTIGDYLYSCSQIVDEEDRTTIIFYDILKNYIGKIDLGEILRRTTINNYDIVVITKRGRVEVDILYTVDISGRYLNKMGRVDKHTYNFIGISIFRGKFFKWIRERYGVDPDVINRELDEIINEYLFNGNTIYTYLINI